MSEEARTADTTRREILKKGAFIAPVVLTLAAVPSFASAGSSSGRLHDGHHDDKGPYGKPDKHGDRRRRAPFPRH